MPECYNSRVFNPLTAEGLACEPGAPECEWKLVEQPIYGIAREGVSVPEGITLSTLAPDSIYTRKLGEKLYELNDHLGNARVIISDRKLSDIVAGVPGKFRAELKSYTNLYPFGMEQPGQYMNGDAYRYGYQGMESDTTIADDRYTTYFRMYDARLGRWMSIDPVTHVGESPGFTKQSPILESPYRFNKSNGNAAKIQPDHIGAVVRYDFENGVPVGVTSFPSSLLWEVKATDKNLTLGCDKYQLGAMLEYLTRSPAAQAGKLMPGVPPPVMIFVTFSQTKGSKALIAKATEDRIAVMQVRAF